MALNEVLLSGQYLDGDEQPLSGQLTFVPSVPLTDPTDDLVIRQAPVTAILNSAGQFSVSLYATDSTNLMPAGWLWNVTEEIAGLPANSWSFALLHADGATQDISALAPA